MILCLYCQQMIPKRIASSHAEICMLIEIQTEVKRLLSVFEGLEPEILLNQLIRDSLLLKKMGW